MSEPAKPGSVPAEASWSAADQEWEVGELADGKQHGIWRWWRPRGELVCVTEYEHGQLRAYSRYHEDGSVAERGTYASGVLNGTFEAFAARTYTSERYMKAMFPVWRHVIEYDAGKVVSKSSFMSDSTPVIASGIPLHGSGTLVYKRRSNAGPGEVWDLERREGGSAVPLEPMFVETSNLAYKLAFITGRAPTNLEVIDEFRVEYEAGEIRGQSYWGAGICVDGEQRKSQREYSRAENDTLVTPGVQEIGDVFEIHFQRDGDAAELQACVEDNTFHLQIEGEEEIAERFPSSSKLHARVREAIADLLANGWTAERAPFLAASHWTLEDWKRVEVSKLFHKTEETFEGTSDEVLNRFARRSPSSKSRKPRKSR